MPEDNFSSVGVFFVGSPEPVSDQALHGRHLDCRYKVPLDNLGICGLTPLFHHSETYTVEPASVELSKVPSARESMDFRKSPGILTSTQEMTTSISKLPSTVEQYRLTCWDRGVFTFELLKLDIIPTKATPFEIDESSFDHTEAEAAAPEEEDETPDSAAPVSPANQGVIEGTYHGTQMAITEIFNLIEQRYAIDRLCFSRSSCYLLLIAMARTTMSSGLILFSRALILSK